MAWRQSVAFPSSVSLGEFPSIGIECRLVRGVPVLFTERGEVLRGQRSITLTAPYEDAVTATATILVERRNDDGES